MKSKPVKCTVHGNVRYRIEWEDAHGNRVERIFKTVAEANEKLTRVRAEPIVRLHSLHDPAITTRSYATHWLNANAPRWADRTLESYTYHLNGHILPFMVGRQTLGDVRVRDVTKPMIKALCVAMRATGYKANTVRITFATASAMLNEAAEDEIIAASPIAIPGQSIRGLTGNGKKRQRQRDESAEKVKAMTAAQVAAFLALAEKKSKRLYPLYLAGARSGLRVGELVGLQIDDLAADARTMHVRRSIGQRSSALAPTPGDVKTYDSIRVVDVSRQLGAALLEIKARRPGEAMARRWRPVPAWLFTTKHGTPYHPRNVLRDMYRLQRLLGWCQGKKIANRLHRPAQAATPAPFNLHSLRHTFATLHLINGKDRNAIQYVQQQLGHSSISVTVDVYGSAIRMRDPDAADRLDALVANNDANGARS